MSRRREQEIRNYIRQNGVTYRQARLALSGRDPVLAGGIPGPMPDGWPAAPKDYVVGAVVGYLRNLVGNSLEMRDAGRVVGSLLRDDLDDEAVDQVAVVLGDVMVVSASAGPPEFPYIESSVVSEYEYGMTLEEVSLGFDASLELDLPEQAAAPLIAHGGVVREVDEGWVTVALTGVELVCTAQLRVESGQAEIAQLLISMRTE